VPSGGGGTQVQGKSNLPTSAGVGGNLRDGLALCQSHSDRLSGEKIVVPRLRGIGVGVSLGSGEGDPEWRAMLHNLRSYGGGREREGTSVIPVVHEFEDVFSDEVPRLPLVEK